MLYLIYKSKLILALTLIVFTFSCTEAVKSNPSDIDSEQNNNADSIVVAEMSGIESQIIDTIWSLPEVIERNNYVDSASNHTRNLVIYIQGKPNEDNDGCYMVKASEDNGVSMVAHFIFYVEPKSMTITYDDVIKGESISLEEWRIS